MPTHFTVTGRLIDIREVTTKQGMPFLVLHVDTNLSETRKNDYQVPTELSLFHDIYEEGKAKLHENDLIYASGYISSRVNTGQNGAMYYNTSLKVDDFQVLGSVEGGAFKSKESQSYAKSVSQNSRYRRQEKPAVEEKDIVETVSQAMPSTSQTEPTKPIQSKPAVEETPAKQNSSSETVENKADSDDFFADFDSSDDDDWDF